MIFKLASNLLDLVFPVVCMNCNHSLVIGERFLCQSCELKLPLTSLNNEPFYDMVISLRGRIQIDFATAYLLFRKGGIVQTLIHQLKYKGRRDIGIHFGYRFGQQIKGHPYILSTDYLIPVPLHPFKLKSRGYNQSLMICNGLSKALGIPVFYDLKRLNYSDTQTHKHRFERWLNVSQNFVLENPEQLIGKRVLLVDDVFTTGATIDACCEILAKVEKLRIGVATLAVAAN